MYPRSIALLLVLVTPTLSFAKGSSVCSDDQVRFAEKASQLAKAFYEVIGESQVQTCESSGTSFDDTGLSIRVDRTRRLDGAIWDYNRGELLSIYLGPYREGEDHCEKVVNLVTNEVSYRNWSNLPALACRYKFYALGENQKQAQEYIIQAARILSNAKGEKLDSAKGDAASLMKKF